MSPSRQPIDIPSFAAAQIALLDAELQAEIGETSALVSNHSPTGLQNAGVALINLVASNRRTGPGGKTVLELGRDPAMAPPAGSDDNGRAGGGLPEHGLRPGDIVLVSDQPAGSAKKREIKELEKSGVRGVVSKRGRDLVSVVLDGEEGEGALAGRIWIVKLADDVTYRRMSQTMERLMKMDRSGYSSLIQTLFGLTSPSAVPADLGSDPELADLEWIDPTLNDSQKEAVRFALASREIAIIHGPPGTGKTHTLIEVILQMVRRGLRLLVCGPSNISVDNMVERLSAHKHVPITRLGHPARLLPSVLTRSLDVLTRTSEAGAIVRDVRAEMDAKLASIKKTRNGREKRQILADVRDLRHEYRDRERRCVGDIIGGSKVVLATLHGAGGSHLRPERFDVVIIDEASQALEAQCWVPLLAAKKAICAGDHLQLPPTVKSTSSRGKKSDTNKSDANDKVPPGDNTKDMSLETTLLDRLLALHGPSIKRMLTTQYRMHQEIMRFPSAELYESKLIAADAVKGRLLTDLPYQVQHSEDTSEPLIFIDTQGGNFPENHNNEEDLPDRDGGSGAKRRGRGLHGESKSNRMEAALVGHQVRRLTDAGVMPADIAVITPYNGQLALLAPLKERYPGLEIGSVDGFQGREKEAVIVSLVRSNGRGDVGFLAEKRRLNVAMTRPRRSLTVIGDSETAKKGSKFLKRWMEFLEEKADLRYPDVADLTSET